MDKITGTPKEIVQWLMDKPLDRVYEAKEYKAKRSLNANAYMWVLITEIANVLRTDKESVYLNMLKRYGQHDLISVVDNVDIRGYVKYYEKAGETFLQGKNFIHYRIFRGSSEYDTREMAILIDGVVGEAKELGIDTIPITEIERLKSMWKT